MKKLRPDVSNMAACDINLVFELINELRGTWFSRLKLSVRYISSPKGNKLTKLEICYTCTHYFTTIPPLPSYFLE